MRKILYSFLVIGLSLAGHGQSRDSSAVFLPEDSIRIRIERLSINSAQSDFSPLVFNNTLMFVSARPTKVGIAYSNELNTDITDLFYVPMQDSLHFGKVKPFAGAINSKFNEGPFTLSRDGNTIYFSGNAKEGESERKVARLQIYSSVKLKDSWQEPEAASFSDPGSSNSHPVLSKDNTILVFCSDMPGGYGGSDLYITYLKNGQWSKPVNLGPKINTASSELFPYLADNALLYFSSNRPGGVGGLDFYTADLSDPLKGGVEHLKEPMNSPSDDFGIWIDSSATSGYFSSNRYAAGKDDIYYFSALYPDFSEATEPPVKTKFCYSFFEDNANQPDDSVSMSYEWDFGDGHKIRSEKCRYCFDKPGDYPIRLNVVEKNSGEVFYNEVSYTLTVEAPPQLIIHSSDSALAGNALPADASHNAIKGYQILNYYWSLGDGTYTSGLWVKHRYKKSGTYSLELGVTARNELTHKIEKFKIRKKITIKDNS